MTGPVDQGQTYRYRQTVKDSTGTLANAGTVTVTITLPDGTTATPTVVNSGTGLYDIAYTTTQAGLHQVRGSATGAVLGTEFDYWTDAFVAEAPASLLIGVDETVARLRAAGVITSDADREQLRWLCMVATDAVEKDLGRVSVRRTIIETHDGGQRDVILREGPIISITSVVEAAVTVTDYVADLHTGELHRGTSTARSYWASGIENIVVTYVAGYTNPPRSIREVALGTVQELWQASQQAPHPLLEEQAELVVQSALSALPGPLRGAYRRLRVSGSGVA